RVCDMATDKLRKELLEEEKRLKEKVEKRYGKSVEELYREREKRIYDAMQVKTPDRVPVIFFDMPLYACKYAGLPYSAAYYDAPAWRAAFKKMFVDIGPDGWAVAGRESGAALEATGTNFTQWPGGNLPPDVGNQVIEQEFMKEDEYDHFLADPSDFIVRVWLPRVYNSLKPLAKLPPLMNLRTNIDMVSAIFASDEFAQLAKAMKKAGEATIKWNKEMGQMDVEMAGLGFPNTLPFGGVQPPFSDFSNNFRTYKGVVMDMFRRPEKLKAALNKLTEYRIATAAPAVRKEGKPTLGSAAEPHRVSDEFMSKKQFEEFVWPNWKKSIEATHNLGYDIVWMFFEGRRDNQLEYFTDFPKGSLLIFLESTDIFRAKEILGDRVCLMGNVPLSMLRVGSPQDVDEYCKKLIKICGKGGGFILANGGGVYNAKPENIKAMVDAAEKYGWY
ncbi:MAG: uroporphyrinogen decarboxylase family protein, partial [Candidatus Omnitrophica bacterium]|nr:uroporphyrinogen decarboxylase family protein [Candidatus Omnitrophota bacterium]